MKTKRIKLRARRWAIRLALAAGPLGAGGCMVGPNYKPPVNKMPAAYGEPTTRPTTAPSSVPASGAADIRWWRHFDDPHLTRLVERSVKVNYNVAVSWARLREARSARHIAQSLLYPQIDVGASAFRFRAPAAGAGIGSAVSQAGFSNEDSLYQLGFDAVWAIDVFGGTRRGIEAATAYEQSTDAERRGVVLMVAAETARAYLELRGTQLQLKIEQDTLAEQRQTLAVTEDRRRNGLSSDLEVLRARTEVESTAAQVPPLQQSIRQYIHIISTLLGLEPNALSDELEQPVPLPTGAGQIAVGVPSDLLRRRPDIQSAERQLAAATAGVGIATSQLFPQLVLGGTGGFMSRKSQELLNSPSKYYLAGPIINWTLFDAGRRNAGVKFAEAQVDAAKASYENTVLTAFREVENDLIAVDRAREQLEDLKRLSASARESAAIARRDYERGILDQLTVLDAQRQSNSADLKLAQGRTQLVTDMVALYKALGGGWEVAEPKAATQSVAENNNKGIFQ